LAVKKRTKFISLTVVLFALLALVMASPAGATPTSITVTTNGIPNNGFVSNTGAGGTGTVGVTVVDAAIAGAGTTTVRVINTTRNTLPVTVTLTETATPGTFTNTSAFVVDTVANENLNAVTPVIGANDGDSIKVVAAPIVKFLKVDAQGPTMGTPFTGEAWDAATGTIKFNVRNSIHLTFSSDKLNPATLQATDFLVGNPGVVPVAVVFPNLAAGAPGNNMALDLRDDVFLTLAADLAPDATPLVQVVGTIEDVAGNATTSDQATAADGIAPSLTITITGEASSRPVAASEVTIRVVSDENIVPGVLPTVTLNRLKLDGTDVGVSNVSATAIPTTEKAVAGVGVNRTWEAVLKISAASVGNAEGLYHVRASVLDAASNQGTGGESTHCVTDGCVDLSKAVLFEFDDEINRGQAPTFNLTPNQGGADTDKTESTSPFIRIDFDDEGAEYTADFTHTGGFVVDLIKGIENPTEVEIDSHNAVTLTVVKLDGGDVSGNVGTVDVNSFLLSTSGLSVGIHTLEVNAQDTVGNSYISDQQFTFEVVLPPTADLSISKIDSPDPVALGTNLTYTITVTNSGPTAAPGVTVTDTLPGGVTFVSASATQGTCGQSGGTVTCNLGSINNGAIAGVVIVVKPTATGTITNTASVSSNAPDPNLSNNSSTASTSVEVCGDLTGEGTVNVVDAITVLQIAAGLVEPTPIQLRVGDLNRDGNINVLDGITVLQISAGLVTISECGPPGP